MSAHGRTRRTAGVAAATAALIAVIGALGIGTPAQAATATATSAASAASATATPTTDPTTRAARATVHESAVPKAGAWSTFFAEATGPDGRPWYLGNDGTVARRTVDGSIESFVVDGPKADDGGWTLIGVATTADALWTADRADRTVRRITTFGTTRSYPVGATPADVLVAGSDGEWVPTDDAKIVHLHADGTATRIAFRSNTPGDTRGIQSVTDADGTLHFIVPSQPWLWTVTTADAISRIELPNGTAATALAADTAGGGLTVGLADGSVATVRSGHVVSTVSNPATGAVLDQIAVSDGIPWFRETIAKKSAAIGYVSGGAVHVVETARVADRSATTIVAGDAGVVVGWAAYSARGDAGLEIFAPSGSRRFIATPDRNDSSAPMSLSADADPTFGTGDGHIGTVGDIAVARVSGSDRWKTQIAAVQHAYPKGAEDIVVASGSSFPDALAAAPAAANAGAPLLLITADGVPSPVSAEIRALGAKRIVIVGGDEVVSRTAQRQLAAIVGAGNVRRLGGADRSATSELVARWGFALGGSTQAVVVNGNDASDTLAATSAIGRSGPVLLVDNQDPTPQPGTARTLKALGVTDVYVAGGTAAVPKALAAPLAKVATVHRIAGATSTATANALLAAFHPTASGAVLATSSSMPDAVAAAVLAARTGAPLLMTSSTCVPESTLGSLASMGASTVTLLGGTSSLGRQLQTLRTCTPASYRTP